MLRKGDEEALKEEGEWMATAPDPALAAEREENVGERGWEDDPEPMDLEAW